MSSEPEYGSGSESESESGSESSGSESGSESEGSEAPSQAPSAAASEQDDGVAAAAAAAAEARIDITQLSDYMDSGFARLMIRYPPAGDRTAGHHFHTATHQSPF